VTFFIEPGRTLWIIRAIERRAEYLGKIQIRCPLEVRHFMTPRKWRVARAGTKLHVCMCIKRYITLCFFLCNVSLFGQGLMPFNPLDRLTYYQHLFSAITDEDAAGASPRTMATRQADIISRLALSPSEHLVFTAKIQEYKQEILSLKARARLIASAPSSDQQRMAALQALVAERQQATLRIADSLLGQLSPGAASRLEEPLHPTSTRPRIK
jgi:hypothetical protein